MLRSIWSKEASWTLLTLIGVIPCNVSFVSSCEISPMTQRKFFSQSWICDISSLCENYTNQIMLTLLW